MQHKRSTSPVDHINSYQNTDRNNYHHHNNKHIITMIRTILLLIVTTNIIIINDIIILHAYSLLTGLRCALAALRNTLSPPPALP